MVDNPETNDAQRTIEWREGDMPYSPQFGDYYFSKADGRLECDHVFIKGNRLDQRFGKIRKFVIGELGFGTGLNFVETVRQFRLLATKDARLIFHSFELHPLTRDIIDRTLSTWPEITREKKELLSQWPQELKTQLHIQLDAQIDLFLHVGDVNDTLPEATFNADAWFLDGFAPERNKDMWSLDLMREIANHTARDGTFATYTAAGWVRRHLQEAGFDVQKVRGYAHKRDMSCGALKRD